MPVFGNDPSVLIAAPDYDQIQIGNPIALVDSIRLIWNTLQGEVSSRKRQSFTWNDFSDVVVTGDTGVTTLTAVLGYKYLVSNDTLMISFSIDVTQTVATTLGISINLPAGYTLFDFPVPFIGCFAYSGTVEIGSITPTSDRNVVRMLRPAASGNFPIGFFQLEGFMTMQIRT